MVFIAAGMGGGTGTGAAAVIARVAKELGILTVGVVTKPFQFEGARRMRIAEVGIAELSKHVDTLIVIPNQNLFRVANEKTTFAEAFVLADQVLYSGVACIVDLIVKEGLINLDFADVRTVMSGMGTAMMGTGEASGERRAIVAAEEAIANPLLDDVSLKGAKGLLLSITGGRDLTLYEVDEAASRVRQEVDPEANIIVGATFDEALGDRVRVSIVASGMARVGEQRAPRQQCRARPAPIERARAQAARAPSGAASASRRYGCSAYARPQRRQFSSSTTPSDRGAAVGTRTAQRASPAPRRARRQPRSARTWQAPGNVTIEEGLPQLSAPVPHAAAAAAAGLRLGSHTSESASRRRPPHEIRRPPRRMPERRGFPAGRRSASIAPMRRPTAIDYRQRAGRRARRPLQTSRRRRASSSESPAACVGESDSRREAAASRAIDRPARDPSSMAAPQRGSRNREHAGRARSTAHSNKRLICQCFSVESTSSGRRPQSFCEASAFASNFAHGNTV